MSEDSKQAEQSELIVDLPHLNEVLQLLEAEGGPGACDTQVSRALELALLSEFDDLPGYAERARRLYAEEIAKLETPDRQFGDIDVLLHDLRVRFERDRGFVPAMGKNRDTAIGYPQHKAVLDPEPLAELPASPAHPTDGGGIHVGVVDTPLFQHPGLSDSALSFTELVMPPRGDPAQSPMSPWAGHATFVVGRILRQAPAAPITVSAGLDGSTGARTAWDTARKVAGLRRTDVAVVNLSFGVTTEDGKVPLVIERAIARLGPDVLVVAAAGNRQHVHPAPDKIWPAALPEVIAVGASQDGERAPFSMKQPWVDCTAEGVDVESTYVRGFVQMTTDAPRQFDGFAKWSGTSFAAATVTGAVAARMSQVPGLTAREAFDQLLHGPDPSTVVKEYVHEP